MSLGSLPRDALDALETIASNLQREPQNPKFRTLRLSNAAVQRRLGSHAARAALAGLGFVKREDAMTWRRLRYECRGADVGSCESGPKY